MRMGRKMDRMGRKMDKTRIEKNGERSKGNTDHSIKRIKVLVRLVKNIAVHHRMVCNLLNVSLLQRSSVFYSSLIVLSLLHPLKRNKDRNHLAFRYSNIHCIESYRVCRCQLV